MFGNLGQLMKNMRDMSSRVKEVQESMKSQIVEGESGAGMVRARMNGVGELIGLDIAPEVIDPGDPDMLADLVLAAVNNTRKKVDELRTQSIRELTGGVDLSSLGIDLSQMV